jgi:hypothetical protein
VTSTNVIDETAATSWRTAEYTAIAPASSSVLRRTCSWMSVPAARTRLNHAPPDYRLLVSRLATERRQMPYDESLANRVREQLAGEAGLAEKAMFGTRAFLLDGNLALAVSSDELMVRVGPDETEEALARPHARPSEMGGRPMQGWVRVGADGIAADGDLAGWVARGAGFARRLPPKR